ncbi:MAG: response regulator transcription factor [Chloroflexi bacterium]|nr:response regulator transcription factor [Chloroflexota bacterium]
MPKRILVVDDDRSIVKILRGYLELAGFEVLAAHTGETALQHVRHDKPDVLILDLMLPDQDGWDVTRTIRANPSLATTPIIMLTARVDDTDKIIGLELGGDDYITKPFNPREVVARVRAILRRSQQEYIPQVIQIGKLRLDIDQHELTINGQVVDLTPTEFKLMQIFMENPGFAHTREELLEKSVGYAYEGMGRTLDTHIRNIRRKIEDDPGQPEWIQTVHSIGYRLVEP